MSLRTKLIGLLILLAAGPLLAIGLIGYTLSERAVAAQLEEQTRLLADRSAEEIARRVRLVESDLRLLGENAESERLLRLSAAGTAQGASAGAALRDVEAFFDAAWPVVGGSYAAVELLDANGAMLLRRGTAVFGDPPGGRLLEHHVAAHSSDDPALRLGSVRAFVHVDALMPGDALDARFGRRGIAAVVYRPNGRVLHASGGEDRTVRRLSDIGLADMTVTEHTVAGPLRASGAGGAQLGWMTVIDAPPLAVLSIAERAEFAAPFDRQRSIQLALVFLLAAAVVPAGAFLLRRTTRSLDELTAAADRVGKGDFMPELPRTGSDEVGRLTAAFRVMTHEIRSKVQEIERSRQLAAVGEFAAELSHEIRNPLTAVKLNLQRLERMLERETASSEVMRPLHIALREVARLDRVVRGALSLGRPAAASPAERRPTSVRQLVDGAVEPLREQLQAQRVELHVSCDDTLVSCAPEELTGAVLNVLLNAVEAIEDGGTLDVRTTHVMADMIDLLITDTGGGIPPEALERLFRPFSTTKRTGTGLGLALAYRAVEVHGGELSLVATGPDGTTFRIRLPLATGLVTA
jgi:signal transduction histidine kinase